MSGILVYIAFLDPCVGEGECGLGGWIVARVGGWMGRGGGDQWAGRVFPWRRVGGTVCWAVCGVCGRGGGKRCKRVGEADGDVDLYVEGSGWGLRRVEEVRCVL